MYHRQVDQINNSLKHTDKAIIALGCSFVQGQGAVDDILYEQYKWEYAELGRPLEIKLTDQEQKQLLRAYPSVQKGFDSKLDFTFMEYNNAFVNVLCKKYFNGSYVPINLGLRGCGNRATIKELYFQPGIDWDKIKEIIVIYCPSGLERFDFINDGWAEHFHWKCMWPHYKDMEPSARKTLWEGYNKTLWSEKFGIIEQIAHVQELLLWCKHKNAKLIITPGFDRRYTKSYFEEHLRNDIERNINGEFISESTKFFLGKDKTELLNMFPWENMFKPGGYDTFIDLVMAQEKTVDPSEHFFQFLGKGSPEGWVTSCSHPSAKAHDLFAKELYNYIINRSN